MQEVLKTGQPGEEFMINKLILLTYLVGCSTYPSGLSYSDKMDKCIMRYLEAGVKYQGTIAICRQIFERKP